MLDPETTKAEINRLADIYYTRKDEFAKASRIRWVLSFIGFVLIFFLFLIQGDVKSLFHADIRKILIILLISCVVTGFHFFVNISIFGWLFQRDIAEGRRLKNIEMQLEELAKDLQ